MLKRPEVLKYANFSRLFYAGMTSELGSFITETALMLLVFSLSGSDKSYLGITRAVFLFFLTLGSILGGPLGEKYNRKNLLIAMEFLRIPLIIILFFTSNIFVIILVNGLIAFFTGIYNPSRQAMTNELVPTKDIKKANSLFGSTMAVLHLLGPFLGANIYAYANGVEEILVFDLVTYILGIYLLKKISYKQPENITHESDYKFKDELIDGLRYILKRLDLTSLMLNCFFAGLCIGILIPLLLPYTTEVLGKGEKEFGFIMSVFGLGGVVGGMLCHKLSQHYKTGTLVVATICIEPIIMPIWLRCTDYTLNLIVFFIWGVVVFIRIPAQLNYISETVETKYLTRVHALLDMAFVVPNISGGMIIALLGNKLDTFTTLHYVSIAFLILILPRLFFKEMQSLLKSNIQINER